MGLVRLRARGLFSLPRPAYQPALADELGPLGRTAAVVLVMAFTWLVEFGFKELLDLL